MSSKPKIEIRITIIWAGGVIVIGLVDWFLYCTWSESESMQRMAFCMTSRQSFQKPLLDEHFLEVWRLFEALSSAITAELDLLQMESSTLDAQQHLVLIEWLPWILPKSLTSFGLAAVFLACILPRTFAYMLLYPGFRLVFGTLYPAYASYKAVRTKNVKEYVKWMMYWIVFALFTSAETFTDLFFSFWFPFYYELKIILVVYLLSPATKGSSILYRKFVHPALIRREQEIDDYIARAKEQGYHTVLSLGSKGMNYATTILMQTAIKGGGGLVNHIRKSYSLTDLPGDPQLRKRIEEDETDDTFSDDARVIRRRRGTSSPRTVSSGSQVDLFFTEMDVRASPSVSENFLPSHIRSSEDVSSGYVSPDPIAIRQEAKDRLVRSSSVSITNRVRTRASAKAERPSSMTEEADDEASDLGEESFLESTPHPSTLSPPPTAGKSIDPLVRPHLQYLFSNLTEEQLVALVSSATNPNARLPEKTEDPVKLDIETINSSSEQMREKVKEPPSLLLKTLIHSETCANVASGVGPEKDLAEPKVSNDVDEQEESVATSEEEFKDCSEAELGENAVLAINSLTDTVVSIGVLTTLTSEGIINAPGESKPIEEPLEEVARVIRRPKKRQAPVPPIGGSLVDLSRLSQISDQLEVSSLLDFDPNCQAVGHFDTKYHSSEHEKSPSNSKMKNDGESNISKMLPFSKLSFSFWHKTKPTSTSAGMAEKSRGEKPVDSGSFVSLHGSERPTTITHESGEDLSERLREMSQSPSSKRRSFIF